MRRELCWLELGSHRIAPHSKRRPQFPHRFGSTPICSNTCVTATLLAALSRSSPFKKRECSLQILQNIFPRLVLLELFWRIDLPMVLAFLLLHFHSLHTAFSITPTQRNGVVMLCDIPAHPLALPGSFSTHALCCSSQSAFLLASSFLLVALFPFFRTWFPIFAQPPLPPDLRQLLTDLPPQNLAAASN